MLRTVRLFGLAVSAFCLLPSALILAGCAPKAVPPTRPNVLLITIDTLRADRIGKGITPALDALAKAGVTFTEARSVVPLTLPAHASILSGQLPPAHGARVNGVPVNGSRPTLAAWLKGAGYQTRAVVGAFVLDRRFGLDAGFEDYDDQIDRDPNAMDRLQAERRGDVVLARALAMLQATPADKPWFLWVHFYDPHAPYEGGVYDNDVRFADAQAGQLIAEVNKRADAARTAIIALGDHGESLREHGEPTHGMLLFEPAIRVPLIIKAPKTPAAVRADPASTIDVAPTVLAMAGVSPSSTLPGHNLLGPPQRDRESYGESQYPTVAGWTALSSLTQDRWKLIVADRPVLFDLKTDPQEGTDVSATRGTLVQAMSARLDAMRKAASGSAPAAGAATVSPETAERLRALGYVAPTAAPVARAGGIDPAAQMATWAAFEDALTAINSGRVKDAVPSLAKIAAANPDAPIFQSTYARALASNGQKQLALDRFRAAVKKWPADPSLYHELAVVARDLNLAAEASRAEDAALIIDAGDAMALNGKGLLLADAGKTAEAMRAFSDAVRIDPTNAVYLANLGNATRATGNLDGAATAYRRALDISPSLGDALNGMGAILVQQKKAAEAVKYLEKAASDPAFIEAQLNLGIALQESGDLERAKAQYRRVAAAPNDHARERDAARALLAQLERR